MMRTIKYLSLFVWVLPASCVYQASASEPVNAPTIGAARPHVVSSYTFRDNGDPNNPRVPRHYLICTYLGPFGEFRVPAEFGECPWVRMFTPADAATALSHRPWGQ